MREPEEQLENRTLEEKGLQVDSASEDSLFAESVLSSSFSAERYSHFSDTEDQLIDANFGDNEYSGTSTETDLNYIPGDLVDLRRLFDEDAVDPDGEGATLEFEEIPDDIDIDEPIEVEEELSPAGKILDFVVKATLVFFFIIVITFIINVIFFAGAILSTNLQQRIFMNISDLDKNVVNIDATVMTEAQNFGRFIVAELDREKPVEVEIYITNNAKILGAENRVASITYEIPDKETIEYNGGKRNLINLHGIKMKLNSGFDSSRLSGFMEPRNGNQFHVRYPRKTVLHVRADFVLLSFWIPIPFPTDFYMQFDMDIIDEMAEKKRLEKTKEFDFNPKFIDFKPLKDDSEILSISLRQPVPKFYAPPFFEFAVHIPQMELDVRQFTMKDQFVNPNISALYESSSPLLKAKIMPFRLIMTDEDMTPNILNIEAEIRRTDHKGFMNVLTAFRDTDTLSTLAFLFASAGYNPEKTKPVPATDEDEGCTFIDFMKTFWGRQVYPVGDGTGPALPSVPELYNPSVDFAMKVNFDGVIERDGPIKRKLELKAAIEREREVCLSFEIVANTHFVISEYKFPLLMLSGNLPSVNFKMISLGKDEQIVHFNIIHENDESAPIGKEIVFKVQVKVDNLKLLSKFALKFSRLFQAGSLVYDKEAFSIQQVIGTMFGDTQGVEIVADSDFSSKTSWISKVASVFNMRINLTGEKVEFIYIGNGKPVIKESEPRMIEYSEAEEEKIKSNLISTLEINSELETADIFYDCVQEKVEELKKLVEKAESQFVLSSALKSNFVTKEVMPVISDKSDPKNRNNIDTKELLKYVNTSPDALNSHKKLLKVRDLIHQRTILKKAVPVGQSIKKHGIFTKIDSSETKMTANIALALQISEKIYDDRILIGWSQFLTKIFNEKNVKLTSFDFVPGSFIFSLSSGLIFGNFDSGSPQIRFAVILESCELEVLRSFHDGITDVKKEFLPFNLSFESSEHDIPELYMKGGVLPAAGILEVGSVIPKIVPTQHSVQQLPGFFDNLTKSHFDFIGYGFYRLIFNAILPNPKECPTSGSSIINVEINLPPTTSFIYATAERGQFRDKKCIAAINTAQPLRIWTQIVDGVLCNMYSVAEGLGEKEMTIQSLVSSERSKEIIQSFSSVLNLRNLYSFDLQEEGERYENALKQRSKSTEVIRRFLRKVPDQSKIALATAIPVNVEILNFNHMMKIMDEFADKVYTKFIIDDPTISNARGHDPPSLLNSVIGVFASKQPIEFNTPEQIELSKKNGNRRIDVNTEHKIVFKIDTETPNPDELRVKTHLFITEKENDSMTIAAEKLSEFEKNEAAANEESYVVHESLSPEKQFVHPVIRWGKTCLRFAFPEFMVELRLSPGDIKITDDGAKIVFDALQNFTLDLRIKKRKSTPSKKEVFQAASIRQIFKRCQDFINQKLDSTAVPNEEIETKSSVSYGPLEAQKFHYFGSANFNSFFLLQAVIIRKMFSNTSSPPVDYDPREDPTFIDFAMLISLGGQRGYHRTKLPKIKLPCFFTNFCSSEQLIDSDFDKEAQDVLKNGPIPVNLHVRNTFQPLTASIASGFANFLPLFYLESYPEVLEWNLNIPKDQVIGIEMNGETMFYGKAGPLNIVKAAEIPYPNAIEGRRSMSPAIKSPKLTMDEDDKLVPKHSTAEGHSKEKVQVLYANEGKFDSKFFETQLIDEFQDEVVIEVLAQVPSSLPNVLRKMTWPVFFIPIKTFTLHPPLIDVDSKTKPMQLGHSPMSVAISDRVIYKEIQADRSSTLIKPSLLTKLFAAFMEETSSAGLELHKEYETQSSCFRFHYTYNYNISSLPFNSVGSEVFKAILWVQFPWAMGPIGFDFGEDVQFEISLPSKSDAILATGYISRAHLMGNVARMRIDLQVPAKSVVTLVQVITPIFMSLSYDAIKSRISGLASVLDIFTTLVNIGIPLKFDFTVGNNFQIETEAFVPKRLSSEPPAPTGNAGKVNLKSAKHASGIFEAYRDRAPEAVACLYSESSISEAEKTKQSALWTRLDLSLTRIYYLETIQGIKPNDPFQIFLQLRTFEQIAVCGLLENFNGLAVMIEYVRPKHPFEILFNEGISYADPPRQYCRTDFIAVSSVFVTENLQLQFTGRYKILVALIPSHKETNLKGLKYHEVKFSEIYVKNTR